MAQRERASTPPLAVPGEEVRPFLGSPEDEDADDGDPALPIDVLIDQHRRPKRYRHVMEERWAPPLSLGLWLALCAVVGLAVPLNHPNVSPHARVAVWVLFIATEVFLALTHFLDPGIIMPEREVDPIVAQLEEREETRKRAEAAGGSGVTGDRSRVTGNGLGAGIPSLDGSFPDSGPVRRDQVGQWARMPSRSSNRVPGSQPEYDLEGSPTHWDWAKCERWCRTCKIWRPPRAAHCTECGYCVKRFDHHCGAVGNCVGRDNHRWFVAFLCSCSGLVVVMLSVSVHRLRAGGWFVGRSSWDALTPWILLGCAVTYAYMSVLACFAVSHVWIFCCDVTTKELMRPTGSEGDRLAGRERRQEAWRRLCGDCNAFSATSLSNVIEGIACAKCRLRSSTVDRVRAKLGQGR